MPAYARTIVCESCRQSRYGQTRRLCRVCWDDPATRARYPVVVNRAPQWREPTEAELDEMVDRQRRTLR